MAETPMLELRDAARYFDVSRPALQRLIAGEGKRILRAVDGVSLAVPKGTTLSLVGESGCGKSTVARLAVGLYRPSAGQVMFDGRDLAEARAASDQRRRMQMIFQDPYASLNPRWRVRDIIAEPIRAFGLLPNRAAEEARVAELLTQVGLSHWMAINSRMSFPAGSVSAFQSRVPCRPIRNSWSAMNRHPRLMFRYRRRS